MKIIFALLKCIFLLPLVSYTQTPSFEQWLSLKQVADITISADGRHVLYTVTSTEWDNNRYDSELWLSRNGEKPFLLTNTLKGSSAGGNFSPDGRFISFVADRGNKQQLFLMRIEGGEAFAITNGAAPVNDYDWSPDSKTIAIIKTDEVSKDKKNEAERYGAWSVAGNDFRQSHVWLLHVDIDSIMQAGLLPCYDNAKDTVKKSDCYKMPQPRRLTKGNFHVNDLRWRPDGKSLAISIRPDPVITSAVSGSIALVDVSSGKVDTLVSNPSSDDFSAWSPDGQQFVYSTGLADTTSYFYTNGHLMLYDMRSGKSKPIAVEIDEEKGVSDWNEAGLFVQVLEKMRSRLYKVNTATGTLVPVELNLDVISRISFSSDGNMLSVAGRMFADLNEVYLGRVGALKKLSDMNAQLKGWTLPTNEIISWKSKDNSTIEGVLIKPANFDAGKKYPLLVVIHGGPTGVDRPEPAPGYVYPIVQWTQKGAVVLRVNYRGSAGYGEKFRSLNVRNLGVGDMWDVMTGVDHLASQGFIDTSKMGAMGWSQGGYISAFLTTNTNRFKAISVGAGISNWVTYYVNTDITPFTQQYLQATPWNDMEIYRTTSPITNINNASTPTLIQHGEFDQRVPIPNAYELYRGLQDRRVPSKLIVYKGFGHGITKPKERLAAVWHNWQWFNHYIWREPMPDIPL